MYRWFALLWLTGSASLAFCNPIPFGINVLPASPDNNLAFGQRAVDAGQRLSGVEQKLMALRAEQGPFADGVDEALLELANIAMDTGQFELALRYLRQSAHVTRVNEGLQSPRQFSLVKTELSLLKRMGRTTELGGRLSYYRRLALQTYGPGSDEYYRAATEDFRWRFTQLSESEDDRELMLLYQDAELLADSFCKLESAEAPVAEHNALEESDVEDPRCWRALKQQIYALYLIDHLIDPPVQDPYGDANPRYDGWIPKDRDMRLLALEARTYQTGRSLLEGHNSPEARLVLADWYWFYGKRHLAKPIYLALQEAGLADLSRPAPIPSFPLLARELLETEVVAEAEVTVDTFGRVRSVEWTDGNEEAPGRRKLSRAIKALRFRPSMNEAGEPVESTLREVFRAEA